MPLGRASLAIAAAGLLTVVLVLGGARWWIPGELSGSIGDGTGAARSRAWLRTTGFNDPEYDPATGAQYSWTASRARIIVQELDRRRPYRLTLRVNAGRGPSHPPPPEIVVSVDGVDRLRAQTSNTPTDVSVDIPVSAPRRLVVAVDVPDAFVGGPSDNRRLGVRIEEVTIAAIGGAFQPTWRVMSLAALATMALVGAVVLCGFSLPYALATGVLVSVAHTALLLVDGAFLGTMADVLIEIAGGALACAGIVALVRRVGPAAAGRLDWPIAAGVTLVAVALKLALFAHPQAMVGDGIFHVHRAQAVGAGNYFFTSITPRPFFEFPYPIALYVNALPFWRWFGAELELVHLLRGLATAADGLVGFATFFVLRRWAGRAAALFFVFLWPFVPIPAQALCSANLTNVYGQGVFGVAMAAILWIAATGRASVPALVAATLLLALGCLSHFSTASVGVPLVGTVAVLLLAAGRGTDRRLGWWILGALTLASAVSYVVYYSHFHDTYQSTLARIAAREGANEARSMAAPFSAKAVRWWQETALNFTWPMLVLAVAGGAWLGVKRRRDGPTLVLAGWALTWLTFAVLGVVSPIEMRANLAAAPLVVALSAVALGAMAERSVLAASAAVTLAVFLAWRGAAVLVSCLG